MEDVLLDPRSAKPLSTLNDGNLFPLQTSQESVITSDACANTRRVILIEDDPMYRSQLEEVINDAPEEDMKCVSSFSENSRDLLSCINETQADIVIVDLILEVARDRDSVVDDDRKSGIKAIERIREELGNKVKILGYTNYPEYCKRALKAGADQVFVKSFTNSELREAIRAICAGTNKPDQVGLWIGLITGVELYPEAQQIRVRGDRGETPRIHLPPAHFGVVYYLSRERLAGAEYWLRTAENTTHYEVRQQRLWSKISQKLGGRFNFDNANLSTWCAKINNQIIQYIHPHVAKPDCYLIANPGQGRGAEGKVYCYTLNLGIKPSEVTIHNDPLSVEL